MRTESSQERGNQVGPGRCRRKSINPAEEGRSQSRSLATEGVVREVESAKPHDQKAKWAARVRELTTYDSLHPVVLNLTANLVEDSKYSQNKELAMEIAFLIKMVADP
ncbi:hypothetical protein KSP40_PGU010371 [Platanthera guangdongensis]|uniref:Uncharacterized protein n=1 Tax=Platanthera guangdongensis TaxID=2320717 RepID=A0ABR2MYU3_9ASPA